MSYILLSILIVLTLLLYKKNKGKNKCSGCESCNLCEVKK